MRRVYSPGFFYSGPIRTMQHAARFLSSDSTMNLTMQLEKALGELMRLDVLRADYAAFIERVLVIWDLTLRQHLWGNRR